jgi:peptide deformylase
MEIVKIPSPVLKKKLSHISADDIKSGKYGKLFEQMHKDMVDNHGVGLAANQVGENLAVFVIDKDLAKNENVPDIYINPEITEYSKDMDSMEEGCLSIPEFYKEVNRPKKIKIKFTDSQGKKQKIKARGFLARVLQHEVDHLNGLTIKDRIK